MRVHLTFLSVQCARTELVSHMALCLDAHVALVMRTLRAAQAAVEGGLQQADATAALWGERITKLEGRISGRHSALTLTL